MSELDKVNLNNIQDVDRKFNDICQINNSKPGKAVKWNSPKVR